MSQVIVPAAQSRMSRAFLSLLGLAALTYAAFQPAGASDKKDKAKDDAPATEVNALPDVVRPSTDEVKVARETLANVNTPRRTLLNAVRYVANREEDHSVLPHWRRPAGIAPLGTTFQEGENVYVEMWRVLRVATLLRAGYPANEALRSDVELILESPVPRAGLPWSELLVELMAADALIARQDSACVPYHERACERIKELVRRAPWSDAKLIAPPDGAGLGTLCIEALARRLASRHGLDERLPRRWREPLDRVCDLLAKNELGEGRLWPEAAAGLDYAQRLRNAVLLGVILSVADGDAATQGGRLAKDIERARTQLAGVIAEAWEKLGKDADDALRGDAVALAIHLNDALLPEKLRPASELANRAIAPAPAVPGAPDVADSGVALLLGWGGDNGNEALASAEAAYATGCLGLLGATGGLLGHESIVPEFDAEQVDRVLGALTALERAELLTFEERVNGAIARSRHWLRERQRDDGSFEGYWNAGLAGHALTMFALLHAGEDRDSKAVQTGMARMRTLKPGTLGSDGPVLSYSLALMALELYYRPEQEKAGMLDAHTWEQYTRASADVRAAMASEDRAWIDDMTKTLAGKAGGDGWNANGPAGNGIIGDNGSSQYAVLGLKAASRLGTTIDRNVFYQEARRLLSDFMRDEAMSAVRVSLTELREGEKDDTQAHSGQANDDKKKPARPRPEDDAWVYPGGWPFWNDDPARADPHGRTTARPRNISPSTGAAVPAPAVAPQGGAPTAPRTRAPAPANPRAPELPVPAENPLRPVTRPLPRPAPKPKPVAKPPAPQPDPY